MFNWDVPSRSGAKNVVRIGTFLLINGTRLISPGCSSDTFHWTVMGPIICNVNFHCNAANVLAYSRCGA
jgi:hypothetical protein